MYILTHTLFLLRNRAWTTSHIYKYSFLTPVATWYFISSMDCNLFYSVTIVGIWDTDFFFFFLHKERSGKHTLSYNFMYTFDTVLNFSEFLDKSIHVFWLDEALITSFPQLHLRVPDPQTLDFRSVKIFYFYMFFYIKQWGLTILIHFISVLVSLHFFKTFSHLNHIDW